MGLVKNLVCDWLGKRDSIWLWRALQPPPLLGDQVNILLLQMDAKLGDAVVLSAVIPPLAHRFPNGRIFVATTCNLVPYWSRHPLVSHVLELPDRTSAQHRFWRLWRILRKFKGAFDVCVSFEPFVTVDSLLAVRAAGAPINIGYTKQQYRLFNVSLHDGSFDWRKRPIDFRLRELLAVLGADEQAPLTSFVCTTPESDAKAIAIVGSEPEFSVFLNAAGAASNREFSQRQLEDLVIGLSSGAFANKVAVYVNLPESVHVSHAALAALQNPRLRLVKLPYPLELETLFSVISRMHLVISPDTGIIHVAAALNVPLVAVFADTIYNPIVWRPRSNTAQLLFSPTGLRVSDVPAMEILNSVRLLLESEKNSDAATRASATMPYECSEKSDVRDAMRMGTETSNSPERV